MNIFSILKKASIVCGLLLVPMVMISNYSTCVADTDADKDDKSNNHKNKSHRKRSKDDSSKNKRSDNRKNKKNNKKESTDSKKVSDEEKKVVQDASKEFFQKLLNNPTKDTIRKFYNEYFVSNTHKSFGINKSQKEEFDNALIEYYFVKFLKSEAATQANGYKLMDNMSKITNQKSKIIKCKLKKDDNTIDMSVYLDKHNNIKDLSIMKTFQLIKGAKTIVENYCKESKQKQYKQLKKDEKLNICIEAWKASK